MSLETVVGITLILAIIEFVFWGFIVWALFKKQIKRLMELKK